MKLLENILEHSRTIQNKDNNGTKNNMDNKDS